MSIEDNLILGYHRRPAFARRGLRLASAIRRFAEQERTEFAIKAPNLQERCSALSGGNQQKVVIARVFSENPDVIIVAQPTRGVDVGAMEYIHHRLLDLRDGGKSILLISADLDEVRSLSDRLAVIYGGRIVAEGKPDTWSDMEIGLLMTGGSLARKRREPHEKACSERSAQAGWPAAVHSLPAYRHCHQRRHHGGVRLQPH
mgnify:CR=1 FL=1